MSTRIDHIGIAVHDLELAIKFYQDHLKLELKEVKELPERGLRIAFFQVGETLLELLAPLSDDSQVSKFLEKNGEGIHHLAFTTPDINAHIKELTDKGIRMATPTATIGAEGCPIAFLHPKASHGVLTEIVERR